MHFDAALGSGATVSMDTAVEYGGAGRGARPMELLLAGMGGCTGLDVIGMLRKSRQQVTGYQVLVSGERATEDPKVFTEIRVEHVVRGKGILPEAVQRAVHLSETKYCSASVMLGAVAKITTTFRIEEE